MERSELTHEQQWQHDQCVATCDQINARRAADYRGKVEQWEGVAAQDRALGLAPRPFPEVPRRRVPTIDASGLSVVIDDIDDMTSTPPTCYACTPLFTWGGKGIITTHED